MLSKIIVIISKILPKRLKYHCALDMYLHVLTHEYSKTPPHEVSMLDALESYNDEYDIT